MNWTENKIKKYIKEGRGKGCGNDYIPWLQCSDMPKNYPHTTTMMPGSWKNERVHHILSELDMGFFYNLQWADKVVDVREYFPLDRVITTRIAEEMKVTHKKDSTTKIPLVMTATFLLTIEDQGERREVAITVIEKRKLESSRELNQLEIQRRYWKEQGIEWKIITEKQINWILSNNVYTLDSFRTASHYQVDDWECKWVMKQLEGLINIDPNLTITQATKMISKDTGKTPGEILLYVWFLLANKIIIFDMLQSKLSRDTILRELQIRNTPFRVISRKYKDRYFDDNVLITIEE